MTCTARSNVGYGSISGINGRGRSESARDLDEKLRQVFGERDQTAVVQLSKYRTLSQINEVTTSCALPNWGGCDEMPVGEHAAIEARQLLEVLPISFASAEILPEPLGSLAFEWRFAPLRTMLVSVSGRGIIEYAGLAGRIPQFHGRIGFTGELPEPILRLLTLTRGA